MKGRLSFEREISDLGLSKPGTGKADRAFLRLSGNIAPYESESPTDISGQAKLGTEIDLPEYKTERATKYGKWTIFATLKTTSSVSGSTGLPVGGSTTLTSKSRDRVNEKGAKQDFGYSGLKNSLKGLKIENLSINLSGEWSGLEIAAFATAKFEFISSSLGKIPASLKILLFKIKEGESPKIGEVEGYFDTPALDLKLPGVTTKAFIRYKLRWTLNKAKVGKEILKKLAKDKLEKEAKKRGVIWLGRLAGKEVVKKLGPLIAAFGVGWDIGTFLNENTIADEVARDVQKAILGDFFEKYHKTDTLGKMNLIMQNSPKIIAALIASGFVGVAAGIGDIVLFKIFGLDKLDEKFNQILDTFRELKKFIPDIGSSIGDAQLSTVFKLGIKFNPKYSRISNPDIRAFATAIYKTIKPIYKEKNGLQKFIDLKLHDILFDKDIDYHRKVVDFIVKNKLSYSPINGNAGKDEVFTQFLDANLQTFLRLLEKYKLISYRTVISSNLSTMAIRQDLVDELFI